MRISVDEAREYFAHPSQLRASKLRSPDQLPDGLNYYAKDGVCIVSHPMPWSGVVMIHLAAMRSALGHTTGPAKDLLQEVWDAEKPDRIAAWVFDSNRAIQALCRRVGMEIDGRLPLPQPVVLYGWRP